MVKFSPRGAPTTANILLDLLSQSLCRSDRQTDLFLLWSHLKVRASRVLRHTLGIRAPLQRQYHHRQTRTIAEHRCPGYVQVAQSSRKRLFYPGHTLRRVTLLPRLRQGQPRTPFICDLHFSRVRGHCPAEYPLPQRHLFLRPSLNSLLCTSIPCKQEVSVSSAITFCQTLLGSFRVRLLVHEGRELLLLVTDGAAATSTAPRIRNVWRGRGQPRHLEV